MKQKTQRKAQKALLDVAEALFDITYDLLEEASYLYWHEPNEINSEDLQEIFRVHGEVLHISTALKQDLSCAKSTKREQ